MIHDSIAPTVYYITFILLLLTLPLTARALLPVVPNDPQFDKQKYIQQTHVDQAWLYSTGSEKVVVAVIDSGVDLDHPDLIDNIWVNEGEIPGNNIDDDNNGFVDDLNGWNFIEKNNDPNPQFKNYSTEGISHGTLVASIIGATGHNNEGIAGIAWNVKIMPLRALNSKGEGTINTAIEAINYAVENGADVINLSFVGITFNPHFYTVIEAAHRKGVVIVAAVGNDAIGANTTEEGGNLDAEPIYPACFENASNDLVIGVGSVNTFNKKSNFSNFGNSCIDIHAPGVNIVGAQVHNSEKGEPFNAFYSGFWDGTSFATPQIAGLAALIKSVNKAYNSNEVFSIILDTADSIDNHNPAYRGKLGRGIVNARRALKAATPVSVQQRDPLEIQNIRDNFKALWISHSIPETATTLESIIVHARFKNKGETAWDEDFLFLHITDLHDTLLDFSPNPIPYPTEVPVQPDASSVWHINVTAPPTPGTYNVKAQLIYKGVPLRGGAFYHTLKIRGDNLESELISHTFPLAVKHAWGQVPVTLTIKNTGTSAWAAGSAHVGLESTENALTLMERATNTHILLPGESTTVPLILGFQASTPGKYYYTLRINGVPLVERIIRIDT